MTILRRLRRGALDGKVWSPHDFLDLGTRVAVERTLQRMVEAGEVDLVGRGLYFKPRTNALTGKATLPTAENIVEAISRRDALRLVGDGMSAVNILGLGTGVSAQPIWYADRAREPFVVGKQRIEIRHAPTWLLKWQGKRAGTVVNALAFNESVYRSGDGWNAIECQAALDRLKQIARTEEGGSLTDDLRSGFASIPRWMQDFLRPLLNPSAHPAWNSQPEPEDDSPAEPRP